jgi:outer membrane protein TolC
MLSVGAKSSRAQGTNITAQTMSLADAVEYARLHSPLLHMAQADLDIAKGGTAVAKSGLLPQLDLVSHALYSLQDHPVVPALSPKAIRFSDTTYDVGVEVRQLLFNFGQTRKRMEAARSLELAADRSLARAGDEVTFQITALFHQRLMTDDLLKAAEGSRRSLQQLVDDLNKRLAVGKAARLDLMKAQVRLSSAESQIAMLQAQRTNAQSMLLAAMGYSGPDIVWQAGDAPADATLPQTPNQELLAGVCQQRYDFQALDAVVASAMAAEEASRSSRWPTIAAFGQYMQYGGVNPEPARLDGNQDDGWEDNYTIGVKLTLPVFDSGLRSGEIAAAHARRVKAEAQREALRLKIQQQVQTAVAELRSAKLRLDSSREAMQAARQALEDERNKYTAGKSTINDLLDAEAASLLAESQYSSSGHQVQIAVVNLRLSMGQALNRTDDSSNPAVDRIDGNNSDNEDTK